MEREIKVEFLPGPVDLTPLAKAFAEQFLKQNTKEETSRTGSEQKSA